MLFTSLEFLLVFFPIALGVYYILPHKARNYWLLLASLFFYAWGEPAFVFGLMFSILFNYLLALRIDEMPVGGKGRKWMLAFTIAGNVVFLGIFKYMNFITENLRAFFPSLQTSVPQTEIFLPVGISFFTFSAISYVVDVYRGVPAQKNIGYLGLYIALFPKLLIGPIVRYTDIIEQIKTERHITMGGFSDGFLRFLYGFNKKMLLANTLAEVADKAFATSELSVGMAWLGAICYTLQIYFDFSGYSDMAIGLGKMFGFTFKENFNYPYISKTVGEFWQRWHISLGSWFRDYVYIPLGGSRVNKSRLVLNLFIVWLLTGIWHGANWTFIVWGILYGVLITIEKLLNLPSKLSKQKSAVFYQTFTMLAVVCGWVLFRSEHLSGAVLYFKAMIGLEENGFLDPTFLFNFREYFILIVIGIIFSTPIFRWLTEKMQGRGEKIGTIYYTGCYAIQIVLFLVSMSFIVMNYHNPPVYFNF